MEYQLKKGVESFEVVDGPYAGRKYMRGKIYTDIPPQEKRKFEEVKKPPAPSSIPPKKAKATGGKEG